MTTYIIGPCSPEHTAYRYVDDTVFYNIKLLLILHYSG